LKNLRDVFFSKEDHKFYLRITQHAPEIKLLDSKKPNHDNMARMSKIWNASEYDLSRRRLIPCYDLFYTTAADLAARTVRDVSSPAILDLGAGTGLMSEFVMQRVGAASLYLLDESTDMTAKALARLEQFKPKLFIQSMTDPLPDIKFHAIVSSVAIHHLPHEEKRKLFECIFQSLAPGGVFVNAEQILGETAWHEELYEEMHIGGARALGSDEEEIRAAKERMAYDKCATLADQISWLRDIGFQHADSFFQSFRFAVYAGWKPENAGTLS
jgi:tRNA (cmo5U34)-methyltransferase